MRIIISFDTEDFTDPAANDVLLPICRTLTERGVQGCFGLVGEKARFLRDRGRHDVVEALSHHSICYHTDNHFLFPDPSHTPHFASEIVEECPWDEAVAWLVATESRGLADIDALFGRRPTTYLRTSGDSAPQILAAYQRLGLKTFAYGPSFYERTRHLAWYAGQHCVSLPLLSEELTYTGRGPAELDRLAAEGADLINVRFHPCRFLSDTWWDVVNFLNVAEPPVGGPYQQAPHLAPEETAQRVARLGELVDYARERHGAIFTTYDAVTAEAARTPAFLSRAQALDVARLARESLRYVTVDGATLSLAEAFGVVVWAALHPQAQHLPVRPLFGPVELPPDLPTEGLPPLPPGEVLRACHAAEEVMARRGRVPDSVALGEAEVGPSALLQAAAAHVLGLGGAAIEHAPPFPRGFDEVLAKWEAADFDMVAFFPNRGRPVPITKRAIKLQYWTYKPGEV